LITFAATKQTFIMVFTTQGQAKKQTKLSYLGNVASSIKIAKNKKKGVFTYILYLAPAHKSGYNVCPKATLECINACLAESGHNRIDVKKNTINKARIAKTKLFFENRDFFMSWLVAELTAHKAKAEKKGFDFSIRLNGTSDLSLLQFKHNGKNILELFSDTQFYDYTKVLNRYKLCEQYGNYDITFSYSGENWFECEAALKYGHRIAVVFEKRLPKTYMGIPVVNADETDLRYMDDKNVICGLIHKKTRRKIDIANQKFIVPDTDKNCIY
jgi:hypothetical protein